MYVYLYRKAGKYGGRYRPEGTFHLLRDDGMISKCGGAVAGQEGYVLVEKDKPVLRSRRCNNCQHGIVVRQ